MAVYLSKMAATIVGPIQCQPRSQSTSQAYTQTFEYQVCYTGKCQS